MDVVSCVKKKEEAGRGVDFYNSALFPFYQGCGKLKSHSEEFCNFVQVQFSDS